MIPETGPITATMIKGEWGLSGSFAVWADGASLINKQAKPISYSDFRGFPKPPADTPAIGSGGSTSTSNGYKHHMFTGTTEFCITAAPTGGLAGKKIESLIVGGAAGGGGGGQYGGTKSEMGGGGGAGAMVVQSGFVPTTVACHTVGVGPGGSGGTAYPLGRGGQGSPSYIWLNKSFITSSTANGGGGGGAIIYGGDFGGMAGACGGGGAGKANHSRDLRWTSNAGSGTQGNNGGIGGYGAGAGGGVRGAGNPGGGQKGGSGGGGLKHTIYDNGEYGVGGGGAGGSSGGGSGYGISGSGGSQPWTNSQSSPTRPGSGGGGGGALQTGGGQTGTAGYRGVVIISIPQS